jgi:hypothetical protein
MLTASSTTQVSCQLAAPSLPRAAGEIPALFAAVPLPTLLRWVRCCDASWGRHCKSHWPELQGSVADDSRAYHRSCNRRSTGVFQSSAAELQRSVADASTAYHQSYNRQNGSCKAAAAELQKNLVDASSAYHRSCKPPPPELQRNLVDASSAYHRAASRYRRSCKERRRLLRVPTTGAAKACHGCFLRRSMMLRGRT